MEKTETFSLLFLAIELTQSISIGAFLMIISWKNRKAVSYLGLFLVVLGVSFFSDILLYFDDNDQFPALKLLGINFIYLHTSLFFIYINSSIIQGNKNYNKIILTFGSIIFSTCLPILFLSSDVQTTSMSHWFFQSIRLGSIFYILVIYLWSIIQIIRHNKQLKDQYSDVSQRELTWVLYLIFFLIAIILVVIPVLYWLGISDTNKYLIAVILNTIWILGLAYGGLYHQKSNNLFKEVLNLEQTVPLTEVKGETSSKKYNPELFNEINDFVVKQQLFLNPELTISNIAILVKKHPKLVSQIINSEANQNFNTYINQFRVNFVKKLLLNTEYEHISIEGLGKMAGFKSTSVYYSSFKKQLNCTPAQYKKRNLTTFYF